MTKRFYTQRTGEIEPNNEREKWRDGGRKKETKN